MAFDKCMGFGMNFRHESGGNILYNKPTKYMLTVLSKYNNEIKNNRN